MNYLSNLAGGLSAAAPGQFPQNSSIVRSLALFLLALLLPLQHVRAGELPVDLRTAGNFSVLAGSTITSVGFTVVNGNMGLWPGTAVSGYPPGVVTGNMEINNPIAQAAQGDLTTAFIDASTRDTAPITVAGNLGGQTLPPGLYRSGSSLEVSAGILTLDGQGDPNAVFIFQIATSLTITSGMQVVLIGDAKAANVFWQVGSSATIGTTAAMVGNILADQSISLATGATLEGRALARIAAVTLQGNVISVPALEIPAPEIAVEQPLAQNIADGGLKDFGSVNVGSTSDLVFTIKNTGTADLTGLGITIDGLDAALFSVTVNPNAPVTGPNGSTTFTVRFAPLSGGLKVAALHIANNDNDENPFDIILNGSGGAAPEIAVEQPLNSNILDGGSRSFGLVASGFNADLVFTIKNIGTANLTDLSINIDGVDASQFSVFATANAPVSGPLGTTTFTIRFSPTSAGLKTAALHIANNDANENPFDITLTGTGVTGPEIAVEQPLNTNILDGGSKGFGVVAVGSTADLVFTIKNTGNADLTGLGITVDGADATRFTLVAGATAPVSGPLGTTTFTMRFTPLVAGPQTATLHIANNDGDENPFDIILTGTGSTAPEIVVEQPLTVDVADGGARTFGSIVTGFSADMVFTIKNTGNANLTGLGISIDGLDAGQFTVVATAASPVSGPLGSTTFTIRFTPASAGFKTAALHIANNDANENPFDIIVSGTGIVPAPILNLVQTSPIVLNPQTGLYEQIVRVNNTGNLLANGVRLSIQGLPADVLVYNASGNVEGTPYLEYALPLEAGAFVDFMIEYRRDSRVPIPNPIFTIQFGIVDVREGNGPIISIDRSLQLVSGRFLIEFTSTPGTTYVVQYTSDFETWKTAVPSITAVANKVQWYDDGPPKTESLPTTLNSRFYRVLVQTPR